MTQVEEHKNGMCSCALVFPLHNAKSNTHTVSLMHLNRSLSCYSTPSILQICTALTKLTCKQTNKSLLRARRDAILLKQHPTLSGKQYVSFSIPSFYLWNDNHLTPSQRTTPDVIRSSAKYCVSIPSSSCFLNWIPDVVSSSMESWAYMSSLARKKNNN